MSKICTTATSKTRLFYTFMKSHKLIVTTTGWHPRITFNCMLDICQAKRMSDLGTIQCVIMIYVILLFSHLTTLLSVILLR